MVTRTPAFILISLFIYPIREYNKQYKQFKAETVERAESIVKEKLGYVKIFEYYHGLGLYNPTPLPKDWDYGCGEPHTVLAIELRGRLSGLVYATISSLHAPFNPQEKYLIHPR